MITLLPRVGRVPVSPDPHPYLLFSGSMIVAILTGMRWRKLAFGKKKKGGEKDR